MSVRLYPSSDHRSVHRVAFVVEDRRIVFPTPRHLNRHIFTLPIWKGRLRLPMGYLVICPKSDLPNGHSPFNYYRVLRYVRQGDYGINCLSARRSVPLQARDVDYVVRCGRASGDLLCVVNQAGGVLLTFGYHVGSIVVASSAPWVREGRRLYVEHCNLSRLFMVRLVQVEDNVGRCGLNSRVVSCAYHDYVDVNQDCRLVAIPRSRSPGSAFRTDHDEA